MQFGFGLVNIIHRHLLLIHNNLKKLFSEIFMLFMILSEVVKPLFNEKEAKGAIKDWLKHAPGRIMKRKKAQDRI